MAQGLTIKPLLEKLKLLGDAGLKEEYLELVARNVALERVLQHLQAEQRPGIESEFSRYQETLIKGEIEELNRKIDKLQNDYPDLQEFYNEQFREELLGIEADTYAEFVRSGRLNKELAPMLENVLQESKAIEN